MTGSSRTGNRLHELEHATIQCLAGKFTELRRTTPEPHPACIQPIGKAALQFSRGRYGQNSTNTSSILFNVNVHIGPIQILQRFTRPSCHAGQRIFGD